MRDVCDLGKQRRSFFTAVNTLKRLNPEDLANQRGQEEWTRGSRRNHPRGGRRRHRT